MTDALSENLALERSQALVRTLLESASEAIVIVDRRGHIVLLNARGEEMFGYHRQELLGQPLGLLLPERHRTAHEGHCTGYMRHPRQRAMGRELQLTARRRDGSEFPVDISLSFAEVEGELYAMSFISDISERIEAQKALQSYSERLEERVEERTRELRETQAQLLAQQLVQRDLELAQQVQASLLPREVPILEGYRIAAEARPARYVSGDLYDFVLRAPTVCHLVLADVAGKGVPAALLTSTARTLVHAETAHENAPAAILTSVQRALQGDLEQAEVFITILAARLDARLGRLCVLPNAGHTEVLWCQCTSARDAAGRYARTGSGAQGTCRRLPATGLPIGVQADAVLEQETVYLRPGDVLLFYSDGLTEANNPQGELFELERLAETLQENAALPAEELACAIVERVEAFRGAGPRSDDLTLIVLKVLPRTVAFEHPAALEHLREIVSLVRHNALAYGAEFAYQAELAASEIVANVIEHAWVLQGRIRGTLALQPHQIQIDVYDEGAACDVDALPTPTLGELREGGFGLHIVRALVDELTYTPASPQCASNHWRLVKRATEETTDHVPD